MFEILYPFNFWKTTNLANPLQKVLFKGTPTSNLFKNSIDYSASKTNLFELNIPKYFNFFNKEGILTGFKNKFNGFINKYFTKVKDSTSISSSEIIKMNEKNRILVENAKRAGLPLKIVAPQLPEIIKDRGPIIIAMHRVHPYRVNVDTGIPAFMNKASDLEKLKYLGGVLNSAPSIDPHDVDIITTKRGVLATRILSDLIHAIAEEITGPRVRALLKRCSNAIKPLVESIVKKPRRVPFPELGSIQ